MILFFTTGLFWRTLFSEPKLIFTMICFLARELAGKVKRFFVPDNGPDWKRIAGLVTAVALLVLLIVGCSAPVTRLPVPDTSMQREDVRRAIEMIDGLDETATDAAVQFVHNTVRSELYRCEKTLEDLERQQRVCAVQLEDVDARNKQLAADNTDLRADLHDLKKSGGWFARFGLRVEWFVYGAFAGIAACVIGWIAAKVTGFAAKIGAAFGGLRV